MSVQAILAAGVRPGAADRGAAAADGEPAGAGAQGWTRAPARTCCSTMAPLPARPHVSSATPYANQFEPPVLFYVLVILAMQTKQADILFRRHVVDLRRSRGSCTPYIHTSANDLSQRGLAFARRRDRAHADVADLRDPPSAGTVRPERRRSGRFAVAGRPTWRGWRSRTSTRDLREVPRALPARLTGRTVEEVAVEAIRNGVKLSIGRGEVAISDCSRSLTRPDTTLDGTRSFGACEDGL